MRRGPALLLAVALGACGRSELDVDLGAPAEDGGAQVSDAGPADAVAITDALEAEEPDAASAHDASKNPACGASTCKGCCDADGLCQGGSSSNACGSGGTACDVCSSGFSCDGDGCSADKGPSDCTPTNCPTGCCAHAFGVSNAVYCYQGTSDALCGLGGQACSDCTQSTSPALQTCTNHLCGGHQFCGPNDCADGCCVGNVCMPGTDDLACGTGGANCQDCTTSGNTCQLDSSPGGQCKPPTCTPATCPTGCCVDDICAMGTQDSACGTGGAACVNCLQQSETCSGGQCQ